MGVGGISWLQMAHCNNRTSTTLSAEDAREHATILDCTWATNRRTLTDRAAEVLIKWRKNGKVATDKTATVLRACMVVYGVPSQDLGLTADDLEHLMKQPRIQ